MADIAEKFKGIPSTCAADATGGTASMDPSVKPVCEEYTVCGRAFTVKMPAGDNTAVLRAIREAGAGDILVIDSGGQTGKSIAGEFVIGLARALRLGGIVTDGSVRDIAGVKKTGFPVFCAGITPSASVKNGGGRVGLPVKCGGVTVAPGDIIIGDADGVVAVPLEDCEKFLALARAKMDSDEARAEKFLKDAGTAKQYLDELSGAGE